MNETMVFDGIQKIVKPPFCECPDISCWVIIYEHKNGNRVQAQWAPVSKEAVEIVNKLGLILECEILSTGEIALYCHFPEEKDYGCDLAKNGAGDREPGKVLTNMILEKAKQINKAMKVNS